MNVLVLGQLSDKQTGIYIMESCHEIASNVIGIDIRAIIKQYGAKDAQNAIMKEIKAIDVVPDLIIVLKGLEMSIDTLKSIKGMFPNANMVNWFFDKFLGDKPIWEQTSYFETLKVYDFYFCSLKGVADKLREIGFTNVFYLDEACYPNLNGEVYLNEFQKKKYEEDISFIGSLGYMAQHNNRFNILKRVIDNGFNIKIWGPIVCDYKKVPLEIRENHTDMSAINEGHSKICQCAKINLGVDQDPALELGHSARLYRVMCCGGLYMCTDTKGLNKMFKTNPAGVMPTGDEELIVFYDENSMVELMDFLLEHEDIRCKIALNGKNKVLEEHTFVHRIKEMLKIISEEKKNGRSS